MKPRRARNHSASTIVLALALFALALTGCGIGLGAGSETGAAALTVTTGYGQEVLIDEDEVALTESDQVMRVLERHAELETRYGGAFVQAIDGLAGGTKDGRPVDWFFYINGIDADRSATDWPLEDGDRVWWDYRDWGATIRVPAVVGQYPEPFASDGAVIECHTVATYCENVMSTLEADGVEVTTSTGGEVGSDDEAVRILIGPWPQIRADPAATLIKRGPEVSGVFTSIAETEAQLVALNELGEQAVTLGDETGLIAATRRGSGSPVWLITGETERGVRSATETFSAENLENRYALIAGPDGVTSLPVR